MPRLSHQHNRQLPLFGRQRELSVLHDCLEDVLAGHGGVVLIGGGAGIGKTALVKSVMHDAETAGITTRSSACYDLMVTAPFAPWRELFSHLPTKDMPSALRTGGNQSDTLSNVGPNVIFEEVIDAVVNQSSDRPLMLVIEDLQWADAASLELLRYVARQIADTRLLLVATYRDTDLGRANPLRQYLPMLVREARADLLTLRPLEADAVRALIDDRYELADLDAARLVQYLKARAQGNPFFIRELLRLLEDERIITPTGGTPTGGGWHVGDLRQTVVPPLARQLIEERLTRLDPRSRSLLTTASVIGQQVPLDLWQIVSKAADDELATAVQNAIQFHLLEETPADTTPLRFVHALVRETLYYDVELPKRYALHQSVGEALARQPVPDPDAVAYHFREGGHSRAIEWLMAAGERAQHLYAWRTAAERFQETLELMDDRPATAPARGWLLYRIGILLRYADSERCINVLTDAERIGNDVGDRHLAAYACADRGLIRCLTGDVRRGLAEMREGVSLLDALPAIHTQSMHTSSEASSARLSVESIRRGAIDLIGSSDEVNVRQGALIFWLAWAGHYATVIDIGERYISLHPSDDARAQDALGDALAGLGHAYATLGRPDDALTSFARARETYQRVDHHFKVGNTAIYELSEAVLPYRADHVMERQWLAEQAEAG